MSCACTDRYCVHTSRTLQQVDAGYSSWSSGLPLQPSPYEGTMRGSDPMLPVRCAQILDPLTAFKKLAVEVLDQLPAVCNITLVADDALPSLVRERCDSIRDWSARVMSFAVPNTAALAVIAQVCSAGGGSSTSSSSSKGSSSAANSSAAQLIEVGAGVGYWIHALQQVYPDIPCIALDKVSSVSVDTQLSATASIVHTLCYRLCTGEIVADVAPRVRGQAPPAAPAHAQERSKGHKASRTASQSGKVTSLLPVLLQYMALVVKITAALVMYTRVSTWQQHSAVNEYHGGAPAWTTVQQGGPERLAAYTSAATASGTAATGSSAATKRSAPRRSVLFLCYPPPAGSMGL
eukprot:3702-Heterococcus_DN1.PRE.1